MPAVEIHNLGKFGVISDLPSHAIPPEAWSDALNVRFTKRGVQRITGHVQALGNTTQGPEFLLNVIDVGNSFWIYTSLTDAFVEESATHTEITRVSGDYTGTAGRAWNGTLLGGIPILNNGTDLPQVWLTFTVGTPLVDLANFAGPSAVSLRAAVIRAFGPYLVALNVTENGVKFPQTLQWSHKADPGTIPSSWDYTDPAVDAGRIQLTDTKGGDILDARLLGDELIIYKEYSTHALRLVGGNAIFAPRLLLSTAGLLAPRCVAPYMEGQRHFVVTSDDIIIHAGTRESRSIAINRVRNTIFNEIDPTNFANSHAFDNRLARECWFAYPTVGNEFPNKAAIWNYDDDTWTFRDFTGVATDIGTTTEPTTADWDSEGTLWDSILGPWSLESRVLLLFADRTQINQLDAGLTFDGTTPMVFAERTGLAIDGKDRTGEPRASLITRKVMHRIWPKIGGGSQVTVRIGKQELVDGPVTFDNSQVFDPKLQRFLDSSAEPVNGLLIAVRYESSDNMPWVLEGHDLYIERLGEL